VPELLCTLLRDGFAFYQRDSTYFIKFNTRQRWESWEDFKDDYELDPNGDPTCLGPEPFAEALEAEGIRLRTIYDTMPTKERSELFDQIEAGKHPYPSVMQTPVRNADPIMDAAIAYAMVTADQFGDPPDGKSRLYDNTLPG